MSTSHSQAIMEHQYLSAIPSVQTTQVPSRSKHIAPGLKTLQLPPEIWYRIITHFADCYTLSTLQKTCRTFRAFLEPRSASFSRILQDSRARTHESWLSLLARANAILKEICLDIKMIEFTEFNYSYRALSRVPSAFDIFREWLGKKFIRKVLDHISEGHTRGSASFMLVFHGVRHCAVCHGHGIFKCRLGKMLWIERASEKLLIECGMDANSEDVGGVLELMGACERYHWSLRDSRLQNYLTQRTLRDGVELFGRSELERRIELQRADASWGAAE